MPTSVTDSTKLEFSNGGTSYVKMVATDSILTCIRTIGSSASVASSSISTFTGNTSVATDSYSQISTINTTTANDFSLRVSWPTARTITCRNATLSTIFHPQ